MGQQAVGYDGGEKIKGQKRFTLIEALGLLITVHVVAGNVPEPEGLTSQCFASSVFTSDQNK
jgi:putative transposase